MIVDLFGLNGKHGPWPVARVLKGGQGRSGAWPNPRAATARGCIHRRRCWPTSCRGGRWKVPRTTLTRKERAMDKLAEDSARQRCFGSGHSLTHVHFCHQTWFWFHPRLIRWISLYWYYIHVGSFVNFYFLPCIFFLFMRMRWLRSGWWISHKRRRSRWWNLHACISLIVFHEVLQVHRQSVLDNPNDFLDWSSVFTGSILTKIGNF